MSRKFFEDLVNIHGTPLLIIDHEKIRKNYKEFRRRLPRVQIYYAVKANSEPEIIKTLYETGASFDVASILELRLVLNTVHPLLARDSGNLQDFIWKRIIYANPVKQEKSLTEMDVYNPLLTYDSPEEMEKIKKYSPHAGVLLRIKVPNNGSVVELSNKFGIDTEDAVDLIGKTLKRGIGVEGLSFHVGSQCNNPENFIKALESAAQIFKESDKKGYKLGETVTKGYPLKVLDIGGGFPVKYSGETQSFKELSKILNKEFKKHFPLKKVAIIAEPGRYLVANSATLISRITLAKHSKNPPCYYIDDGIYHTYSAMMFDHFIPEIKSFKRGPKKDSVVFGPTCDGLDQLSENKHIENSGKIFLPKLKMGDLLYTENIGAYSIASSTNFNGFPGAKVIHLNV